MTAPVTLVPDVHPQKLDNSAPVSLQTAADASTWVDTQRWHVQFVMPGKYTLESLPLPNNDAKTLRKVSVKLWKRRRIQDSTQTAVFTKKPRQLPNGCKIANWFLKLNLRMHEDIGVQSLPNQWTDRYQLSFSAHGARSDARG